MGQLVGVEGVEGPEVNYLPNKFKELKRIKKKKRYSMKSLNYGRSSLFGMFVTKVFWDSLNSWLYFRTNLWRVSLLIMAFDY